MLRNRCLVSEVTITDREYSLYRIKASGKIAKMNIHFNAGMPGCTCIN